MSFIYDIDEGLINYSWEMTYLLNVYEIWKIQAREVKLTVFLQNKGTKQISNFIFDIGAMLINYS